MSVNILLFLQWLTTRQQCKRGCDKVYGIAAAENGLNVVHGIGLHVEKSSVGQLFKLIS